MWSSGRAQRGGSAAAAASARRFSQDAVGVPDDAAHGRRGREAPRGSARQAARQPRRPLSSALHYIRTRADQAPRLLLDAAIPLAFHELYVSHLWKHHLSVLAG